MGMKLYARMFASIIWLQIQVYIGGEIWSRSVLRDIKKNSTVAQ